MIEDEHNLVARAKMGETEAFGLLYDFYMPRIYRFVLLKVGQREEAEDLTHQAFLKAWENIEQYDFRGYSFGSWLYRIARNVTVDYYRGARLEVSVEDVSEIHLAKDDSLEENVERSLEWQGLVESIKKLKEVEQDVIVMRFVEDLSLKDIASAIGKSEGAVKVIQHRAIKNLKHIVENKEENG